MHSILLLSLSKAPRRFNTTLISTFALAAVLLAVLGIYSIIAFPLPHACR
jgi:putative ABC transport system permease protein